MAKELKLEIRPLLATGINAGDKPSSESIATGTVAMENHPDYQSVIEDLAIEGFNVIIHGKGTTFAYVSLQLLASERFEISKELHLVAGMRWLDLEHELGHIEQIMARFITQGQVLVTEATKENQPKQKYSFEMQKWQDYVFEFHVRLIEFLRLYHRQVDKKILEDHLKGVINYSNLFWKISTKKWKSPSRHEWITHFFPDIFELRDEVAKIHVKEFYYLTGRVK